MESRAEWLTDKYILLMLLVFPLWTGFSGYAALTFSKFLFFAAATGLWLTGLFVFALLEKRPLRPGGTAPWAAAFVLAAGVSALLSPFGTRVLLGAGRYDGLATLLLYGGIFWGVSAYGRPRGTYVAALAVSACVCCLIALLQLDGGNPLGLFPGDLTYYDSGTRYTGAFLGTIGNTDVLAAFFSLCIPLFMLTAALSRRPAALLLLLPAGLCLWVLLRSGVASGALALAAGVLILIPYGISARFGNRRLTLLFCALSAAAAAAGLAVVYFWRGTEGTVYELSRALHGQLEDSFGSSRILIWREVLGLVRERPWTGGGPDTLTLRTGLGFSRYVPETGVTLSTHVDNAHNEYLGLLVNLGVFGLAAYLLLVARTASAWLRNRRGCLIPALGGALTCYWIQSFFGLGLCLVVPLVWIFMGLLNAPLED